MSSETVIKCDVCKSQDLVISRQMQLLRHFDCTDGRSFSDYLVIERIDLCGDCLDVVQSTGKYLVDERVQGYGKIVFQEDV